MTSLLLNPQGPGEERRHALAPRRLSTLDGATVGLLTNTKLNAEPLLRALGELLQARYALNDLLVRVKPNFSLPAPAAILDELAARCDVVIAGVGD
jgi:hypothetical protein